MLIFDNGMKTLENRIEAIENKLNFLNEKLNDFDNKLELILIELSIKNNDNPQGAPNN
jgi:chaperonin cofactor prefoldin